MNYRKLFTLSVLFLFLITSLPIFAQNLSDSKKEQQKSQFVGLYKYLASKVQYSSKALFSNLQGKTTFLFNIENGQIQNVETALNLEGLSENVKNLIAAYTGLSKTINGKYSISIIFQMEGIRNALVQEEVVIPADYIKLSSVNIMAMGGPSKQNVPDNSTYKSEEVDTPPNFPGGYKALQEYFYKNIKYSEEALKNKVEGKIYFSFKIDYDGNVKDVKIVRGLGSGLDEIVKKVIKDCPKWNAAIKNGQTVSTKFSYFAECRLPNP
ncbi:TonB family protein [Pedobacter psychrodurus]|uniref:TonB family protein n=1 Tax=Pedobacter psychrodurus TaxID=2530456 RepID=A0A4R0Q828_9SPHI|nr:TonB family protein [Pedobacter psychrodurus]TCD29196.1 TonB family protein [Pedobacter psychrodurus]